jgi:hypothetical protein
MLTVVTQARYRAGLPIYRLEPRRSWSMSKFFRFAVAALGAFLLTAAAPALAGDCANCQNCPKKSAADKTATAEQPGDKKPGAEKPKCECTQGKDCACGKDKCKCAEAKPKAA